MLEVIPATRLLRTGATTTHILCRYRQGKKARRQFYLALIVYSPLDFSRMKTDTFESNVFTSAKNFWASSLFISGIFNPSICIANSINLVLSGAFLAFFSAASFAFCSAIAFASASLRAFSDASALAFISASSFAFSDAAFSAAIRAVSCSAFSFLSASSRSLAYSL